MRRRPLRLWVHAGLLAVTALAVLPGCRQGPTDLPPLNGPLVRLQHAGGLFVDLPAATVGGELTASGIRLRPLTAAQQRRPWTLDLTLASGPGAPAGGTRDWVAGGRTLHQAPVRTVSGGSGGSEHMVDAWMACGDGHVAARYRQQAEDVAELELAPAWQLVLASGCPKSIVGPG